MTASTEILSHTRSICPVCGCQLEADRVRRGTEIFLERRCPRHGEFSTVIWRGSKSFFEQWVRDAEVLQPGENLHCPCACGICADHKQDTCCILYEITSRCNLHCPWCFAIGGEQDEESISFEQIDKDLQQIIKPGKTFLQLSGGEPSVRQDLPRIIARARELGAKYIQLNSNGIRFAEDEAFCAACGEAGLSFVFLQFDGLDDAIYRRLRGRELLETKLRCIENCGRHQIGVTLVPTLVPEVNTHQVWDIVRFGADHVPVVRGVHFQPVSYFGRYPSPPENKDRYTLGDLLTDLYRQSKGAISPANIAPSHCDHPLCGFHSSYIVTEEGEMLALTQRNSGRYVTDETEGIGDTRWELARKETGEYLHNMARLGFSRQEIIERIQTFTEEENNGTDLCVPQPDETVR